MLPFLRQKFHFHFLVLVETLYLEERDNYFWGRKRIKYMSNKNIVANEEIGESLIKIHVT